jgi:hypothetical protein
MTKIPKTFVKNLTLYSVAGVFILMVCSLGITFALGANQMEVVGQAYFVSQFSQNPERLPIFPNDNNGQGFFTTSATGQQNIHIIHESFENGDFYLSICTANSNNGNNAWTIDFSFLNPTTYTWINGAASISPWPASAGGLNDERFTFSSATIAPATLTTNQTASVQLTMRSQLGREDTQGAAIVTVQYDLPNGNSTSPSNTRIFFKYYARNALECPL